MAFTRFYDDPCRVMKHLQESTDQGVYMLNVPGNGTNMPFVDDPHVRLQKWGANRSANLTSLESSLFAMDRKLSHDCDPFQMLKPSIQSYPRRQNEVTGQSRTVTPAWQVRSVAKERWETPFVDLHTHALIPFQTNSDTRQSARDQFSKAL